MAKGMKEEKMLLEMCTILKAPSYKVQVTIGLSRVPWNIANVILNTGSWPNLVSSEVVPRNCTERIKTMKSRWLRSAEGTPIQVNENIMLLIQFGKNVASTASSVVEHLVVIKLLDAAFIDKNV